MLNKIFFQQIVKMILSYILSFILYNENSVHNSLIQVYLLKACKTKLLLQKMQHTPMKNPMKNLARKKISNRSHNGNKGPTSEASILFTIKTNFLPKLSENLVDKNAIAIPNVNIG